MQNPNYQDDIRQEISDFIKKKLVGYGLDYYGLHNIGLSFSVDNIINIEFCPKIRVNIDAEFYIYDNQQKPKAGPYGWTFCNL